MFFIQHCFPSTQSNCIYFFPGIPTFIAYSVYVCSHASLFLFTPESRSRKHKMHASRFCGVLLGMKRLSVYPCPKTHPVSSQSAQQSFILVLLSFQICTSSVLTVSMCHVTTDVTAGSTAFTPRTTKLTVSAVALTRSRA